MSESMTALQEVLETDSVDSEATTDVYTLPPLSIRPTTAKVMRVEVAPFSFIRNEENLEIAEDIGQ